MTEQAKQETVRDELKNKPVGEFLKRTRAAMEEGARELGMEDEAINSFGTKQQLYDAMVEAADLPDPSLRGSSTVESPVALVWTIADRMHAEARDAGNDPPRRKDCVDAAIAEGVAYYTARTQYQAWYQHTNKGKNLIVDGNTEDLPEALAPKAEPETEEAEA